MLVRRLPVVLLFLIKALEAAVPSRSDLYALADTTTVPSISQLSDQLAQLEIKVPEVNANGTEPLSFFEISEQIAKLVGKTLTLNTKSAVRTIERGLVQILKSNITLHDIAPTIGTLPIEAKELVLAAIKVKAHTLLNLLQMVYIWHDDHQYHWFVALIENEPWRNRDLKNDLGLFPLNWRNNLRAICEADNGALAVATRNNVPLGDALESFDKELLLLCAEYDSTRVFESTKLDPVKLGEHLELLAKNSAAKLLQSYQNYTKIPHLHLEKLPFPGRLPANADDFKFLMENGYSCFPMVNFIRFFCKEGRLDLLKYLQTLDPLLIPNPLDIVFAAERNFVDILDWCRQFTTANTHFNQDPFNETLLNHGHFDTLRWWVDINGIIITQEAVESIVESGALEILQWIDEKQLTKYDFQKVTNIAARHQHLSILQWLYEKYRVLPSVAYLKNATCEMLDWMKSESCASEDPQSAVRLDTIDIKYKDLISHGLANFELLQWVFKNAPLSVFDTKKEQISNHIRSKEMMLWLHKHLQICPTRMEWAYKTGNLEAIEWAIENCKVYPTEREIHITAQRGHFHIIKWIHKNVYPEHPSCLDTGIIEAAIWCGELEIAKYLVSNVFPGACINLLVDGGIRMNNHLALLKWACEHDFIIAQPEIHVFMAIRDEDLQALEWISVNFPSNDLGSNRKRREAATGNMYKYYRWFLEKYPSMCQPEELHVDARLAYDKGSLEIIKVLHEKHPSVLRSLSSELSEKDITRANYHVHQWFAMEGYLIKQC